MQPYVHEMTVLRTLARLDLAPEQCAHALAHLRHTIVTLDWGWLIRKSIRQGVPSIVIGRLCELEQALDFRVPDRAIEELWSEPISRDLVFAEYEQLADTSFPSALARLRRALQVRWEKLCRLLEETLTALDTPYIQPLLVKGSAMSALYPPHTRDLLDIDVLIPDQQRGWEAIQRLRERGFAQGMFDLGRRSLETIGVKTNLDSPEGMKLELHMDGFDILGMGYLEAPLWLRATRKPTLGCDSAPIPSLEDLLIVLTAHILRHTTVYLRDLNDAYTILTHDPQHLDWAYIWEIARRNELSEALQALIGEAEAMYGRPLIPEEQRRAVSLPTLAARLMVRRTQRGIGSWAVPYRLWYVPRFDYKRHGLALAASRTLDCALMLIEHDFWRASVTRQPGSHGQQLAAMLRSVTLALLLRNGWRLWELPTWINLLLFHIQPTIGTSRYKIVAIDRTRYNYIRRKYRKAIKIVGDLIICRGPNKHVPEFLVTPVGMFYSTHYTGKFKCSAAELEQRAAKLITTLAAEGLVIIEKDETTPDK